MKRGFTLIELSIVLVIIGLIVGGVLVGQDLIKAASIRSVFSQAQSYTATINTFRLKYNCIPGDCKNATVFFGAADGGDGLGSDCTTANDSDDGDPTCNGNGDKLIPVSGVESYLAWQHMANAGLIEGHYSGTSGPGTGCGGNCDSVVGVNVPTTKMSGVSFTFISASQLASSTGFDSIRARTDSLILSLGMDRENWYTQDPFLTATEAQSTDIKFDDGSPVSGTITARKGGNSCTDNTTESAVYSSGADNTKRCLFFFVVR